MVEDAWCTSMTTRVKTSRTNVKHFILMHCPVTPALKGWRDQEERLLGDSPAPGSVEDPISRK